MHLAPCLVFRSAARGRREDTRGTERRQILQPKTRSLKLGVSELPGLNNLGWFANPRADDAHGILKGNVRDGCVQQFADKGQGLYLLSLFQMKPARAANGQVCAWWVRYEEVKTIL